MKHLYLAENNAMNFLIIRDMQREDDDAAIINWDLSDSEISNAIKAFEEDENTDEFYAVDPEWGSFDEITHGLWNIRWIA